MTEGARGNASDQSAKTLTKALSMLGLCTRAGAVKTGVDMCETQIKHGGAHLALVDEGASAGSKKAISDACAYIGVEMRELPAGAMGAAIGRPGRMACVVLDKGFAERISELLDQQRDCGGACRE